MYDDIGNLQGANVTPVVYPRLFEVHRFGIQSIGQKPQRANTFRGHRNILWHLEIRTPLVEAKSEFAAHCIGKARWRSEGVK